MFKLDSNTALLEAREEGFEKDREEGEHIKSIEIVRNMKQHKIDINTIAEITGLSKEEIENL